MKRGLISVEVGKGMFEGEKAVSFQVEGRSVSAIVHERSVKAGNKLEVEIEKVTKDKVLVAIPGESFSTRKVWIGKEQIKK